MLKGILVAVLAILALAVATAAEGAVTVLGGGLAEQCSKAAVAGENDRRFEDLCALALDTEFLSLRDRAGTYVNRGVFKLRRAAYADAARDFSEAARLQPDMGEAYVNRGAAFLGQRRYAESLPDLNRALELGVSEPAKAYYNRAIAHEGMDNAKAAYFDYQKAVEIDPEWAAPREQLTRFTVSRR
ncbi:MULTISPECIES: tetratricopeptide repeat protein [Phenylobacterium]|uniref:Tetratricopeptide (TPR) repeat protein n=1 Tax=Phenylobacterium koreense TaxID=266125 RepID=A0ABV2EF21_9CAUL